MLLRCILQGLPSYPVLAIPIKGLLKSSSENPIAYNIACAAGCELSCVIEELYLFNFSIYKKRKLSM
jgi:hypothetical protein